MASRRRPLQALLCAAALLIGLAASAAETGKPAPGTPSPSAPTPSADQRQEMAAIHEKMAACLRSERSYADCRSEMWNSCQTQMGQNGCPMMGMMGPGMVGRRGMGPGMMYGAPPPGGPPQQVPAPKPSN